MAVSSKKTFIFRHFFNQVILACVLRILTWQEVLTDRNCDICHTSSHFFVRLPSTSCMIFFLFLILSRVMIYFSSILTNRWFVEIQLWFTWLSCFFWSICSITAFVFLLWVCFLLCIYLLFYFFFSVSYVIVNLFPIPNVYN